VTRRQVGQMRNYFEFRSCPRHFTGFLAGIQPPDVFRQRCDVSAFLST